MKFAIYESLKLYPQFIPSEVKPYRECVIRLGIDEGTEVRQFAAL